MFTLRSAFQFQAISSTLLGCLPEEGEKVHGGSGGEPEVKGPREESVSRRIGNSGQMSQRGQEEEY